MPAKVEVCKDYRFCEHRGGVGSVLLPPPPPIRRRCGTKHLRIGKVN